MSRRLKRFSVGLGLVFALSLAAVGARADEQRNSCGCYKGESGACYCDKGAKCGCPGDCEPKGCEEQRSKELQKQIDEETRKASGAGHKHGARPGDGDEGGGEDSPAPRHAAAARKMSAAQTHQLAKLLDLYLGAHPDARGRSIEQVRDDLSGR